MWAATSASDFISIGAGASGTGRGAVTLSIAANTGALRQGTVTIAGQTVSVTEDAAPPPGCAFVVMPTGGTVPAAGGTTTVTVTVTSGVKCAWTATSSDPFVTVTSGASGMGSGSVVLAVAANTAAARTGSATVAGQTVTLTQAGVPPPCAFKVSSTSLTLSSSAQTLQLAVYVTQGTGCAWTATSSAPFITVTAGGSQTGNGTVTFAVAVNGGAQRVGTLTVAGQTVTITQTAAPCAFAVTQSNAGSILPNAQTVTITVTVTQGSSCAWTAVSNASFLTVTSGASGTGMSTVSVSVSDNTGAVRTGTLTVAGATVFIRQLARLLAVLSYRSDLGDPIGLGQTKSYTLAESQITAITSTPPPPQLWYSTLQVTLNTPEGIWQLILNAPSGQSLAAALYTNAARAGAQPPSQPGLLFSGLGRTCTAITGRFIIADPQFQPADRVESFHVVFEQHCEGATPALVGDLWISGDGVAAPPPLALPSALIAGPLVATALMPVPDWQRVQQPRGASPTRSPTAGPGTWAGRWR